VALDEDKIIGFCEHTFECEISRMYVHKDHLRKGIGSRLLEIAEASLRTLGCKEIQIESTVTAKDFYEKMDIKSLPRLCTKEIRINRSTKCLRHFHNRNCGSMPKHPKSRQSHRDSQLLRFRKHLLITHGSAGLDDGADAVLGSFFHGIGEWEKCVARHHGTFHFFTRALHGDPGGIDSGSLSGADADGDTIFYQNDRI
jgi:hypothetical protein